MLVGSAPASSQAPACDAGAHLACLYSDHVWWVCGLPRASLLRTFIMHSMLTGSKLRQELLETFSWLEADRADVLAKRNARCPDSLSLAREPLFCLETCCKLFYWSCLAYSYREEVCLPACLPACPHHAALSLLSSLPIHQLVSLQNAGRGAAAEASMSSSVSAQQQACALIRQVPPGDRAGPAREV